MIKRNKVTDEIVLACQNGDEEVFTFIYEQYYNRVYFMAKQYFDDHTLAEDVVQNTFLQMYKHIGQLKVPAAFHSWMMRITYYECLSIIKKKKFKYVHNTEEFDVENIGDDSGFDALNELEKNRVYEIISKQLESLSVDFKSIGYLRFFEELSLNEISEIMEIPVGTVKSRIHTVKKHLSLSLRKENITPKSIKTLSISPAAITGAYYLLSKQNEMNTENSTVILQHVLKAGSGIFGLVSAKAAIVSFVSIACISGVVAVVLNLPVKEADKPKVEPPIVEPVADAKIIQVNYDKQYTSDPFTIEVQTTSGNYDNVLIDGVVGTQIYDNGTYKVSIAKNGKVLDEKEIIVDNFDFIPPELLDVVNEGRAYTIHLSDEKSKINPENIQYYVDGSLSNNFRYNVENQTITFIFEKSTMNVFDIHDYAGNLRKVELDSAIKTTN